MKPRNLIALPVLALVAASCSETNKDQNPNILLIVADDLGLGDVSAYGSQTISTPNIDRLAEKAEGDFGYIGRDLKGEWDTSNQVFNSFKRLGVDSVFVGHEHCNSASVVYEGIRFQFGQKSSQYDRFNCLEENGIVTAVAGRPAAGLKSMIGGSVIVLSEEDGAIIDAYIYYCGFENGTIDWSQFD